MKRTVTSVIESLGVYLPPKQMGTQEILEGCVNHVRVPLERLTGIRSRHRAGDSEFSIHLAANAVKDCLQRSRAKAEYFELLICANISRFDGPGSVSYEPSTAAQLRRQFGFTNAIAMDLSNACAGVWTAVYVVDALIRSGAIRRGMVVSGEYITYLTDTAQKEIVDYLDPQLASLTLGDSGVAVALETSPRPEVGFHDIELFTLSKYSRFCIAKPSTEAHGGAAMYTDAVKVTASVVPRAAEHADEVLQRHDRTIDQMNHIIPHQTSRLTMQDALKALSNRYTTDLSQRLINNLAERANTATTSHMLALWDSIQNGRIGTDEDIMFLISGSGQTTGTAVYTCDDLPERIRANGTTNSVNRAVPAQTAAGQTLKVPMSIESIALVTPGDPEAPDTLDMLESAATQCLQRSSFATEQIEMLLSVGVYRKDFLTEPAMAALLAGELRMNHDRQTGDDHKTLAFDILNGPLGFLNACYLLTELSAAGCLERAMIVASEIENNRVAAPSDMLGLREVATATILRESEDGETGFQAFGFYHFAEYHDHNVTALLWNEQGQPYLKSSRKKDLLDTYLQCIEPAVAEFLKRNGYEREEIRFLLPPQISPAFVSETARRLEFAGDSVVDVSIEGQDLATSATPVALQAVLESQRAQSGDLGVIVNVGSGIQVACAVYQF